MTNIEEIEIVLSRMEGLLTMGGRDDWAQALRRSRVELRENKAAAVSDLLPMFGGMGSLNDIVLYRNGQPLREENDEFETLRGQLYELCHRRPNS